ncbi:MAG: DUF6285 domain-containing protein [Acidimicrobiia bacterium]|nr:DUF6285 domain-containing protein [Acidimicrobiia bacterium]
MQDLPTAADLLDDIGALLADQVIGALDGTLQYHVRVAANLIGMLAREARLADPALPAERDRLVALVGEIEPGAPLAEQVRAGNAELARRLRADEPIDEAAVWAALSEAVAVKLAISRPGYERYDMAAEVGRDTP